LVGRALVIRRSGIRRRRRRLAGARGQQTRKQERRFEAALVGKFGESHGSTLSRSRDRSEACADRVSAITSDLRRLRLLAVRALRWWLCVLVEDGVKTERDGDEDRRDDPCGAADTRLL